MDYFSQNVSTHSRPKAAAEPIKQAAQINLVSTHSRPKAAAYSHYKNRPFYQFQHTAARRRLPHGLFYRVKGGCFNTQPPEGGCSIDVLKDVLNAVSTHSRPKAAAPYLKKQEKSAD